MAWVAAVGDTVDMDMVAGDTVDIAVMDTVTDIPHTVTPDTDTPALSSIPPQRIRTDRTVTPVTIRVIPMPRPAVAIHIPHLSTNQPRTPLRITLTLLHLLSTVQPFTPHRVQ